MSTDSRPVPSPPGHSVVQNIGMGVFLTLTAATTTVTYIESASIQLQTLSWSTSDNLTTKFREHADCWKAERRASASSSSERMFASLHYLRIIAMGPSVVPVLLTELEERPDHWDRALEVITGENPAPQESAGKLKAIAQAWVDWGRARRLV